MSATWWISPLTSEPIPALPVSHNLVTVRSDRSTKITTSHHWTIRKKTRFVGLREPYFLSSRCRLICCWLKHLTPLLSHNEYSTFNSLSLQTGLHIFRDDPFWTTSINVFHIMSPAIWQAQPPPVNNMIYQCDIILTKTSPHQLTNVLLSYSKEDPSLRGYSRQQRPLDLWQWTDVTGVGCDSATTRVNMQLWLFLTRHLPTLHSNGRRRK